SATSGDSILLSVAVVGTPTLRPSITLLNPSSVNIGSNAGVTLAQVNVTASATGTYTLQVASGLGVPPGTGSYLVMFVRVPGTFVLPAGDDGGQMVNGANHSGSIFLGDLDVWTFDANQGDAVSLSIGKVDTNASLRPFMRLFGPNGVNISSDES